MVAYFVITCVLTIAFVYMEFLVRKHHPLMYRKQKWSMILYFLGTLIQLLFIIVSGYIFAQ